MKRRRWAVTALAVAACFGAAAARAQTAEPVAAEAAGSTTTAGWSLEAVGQLSFTQTRFDNWGPGGENVVAWQGTFTGEARERRPVYTWANTLKLAYGQNRTGEGAFLKTTDEIRLESVWTYLWLDDLNPFVALRGETQFTEGTKEIAGTRVAVSNFLDPGVFTESLGIGYTTGETFTTRLGAAAKQTVADRHPVPYTDDPETAAVETFRNEFGAEWVTDLKLQLSDLLRFASKLEAFSGFERLDATKVRWDNQLTAAVAPYVNVNFNLELRYDRKVSPRRQLQQVLAVGLTYSLL